MYTCRFFFFWRNFACILNKHLISTLLLIVQIKTAEADNHADNSYNAQEAVYRGNSSMPPESVMNGALAVAALCRTVRHERAPARVRLPTELVELDGSALQAGGVGLCRRTPMTPTRNGIANLPRAAYPWLC